MFAGFLTIFQFIWPFLKEALFGNGTFKVWFRQNYLTVLWFVMMMIMLLMVLALTNMLKNAESEITQNQASLGKYHDATNTYKSANAELLASNQTLREENDKLKKNPPHCTPTHTMLPTMYVSPPKSSRADENRSILHRLHAH